MEVKVNKCEDCPLFSIDIDYSEYCSKGGSPEERYSAIGWEEGMPKRIQNMPNNCPLKQESITVVLEQ